MALSTDGQTDDQTDLGFNSAQTCWGHSGLLPCSIYKMGTITQVYLSSLQSRKTSKSLNPKCFFKAHLVTKLDLNEQEAGNTQRFLILLCVHVSLRVHLYI